MADKRTGLIYSVNDRPPLVALFFLGIQQAVLMCSTLALPVVIVREIGSSFAQVQSIVCFSMIASGMGTLLQAIKKGPIGSGYLCPNLCGPSYLSVSVQAAWTGGLPLMHGMTMLAGVFEGIFSRLVRKIRFLFPTQITGLVVLMVGVSLVPLGVSKFLGLEYTGDPIEPKNVAVGMTTLFFMIGLNTWTRGRARLYCVLLALVFGYVLSAFMGILTPMEWSRVADQPLFQFPPAQYLFHWSFDWSLVVPFAIVSLCASLKSFGNIITCQKINDPDWREPEMKTVGRGLLADSISVFTGGFLGGMAVDTSASNIGLSAATGATSRFIGFAAGGMFICLAFLPKFTKAISIIPAPVMGAIVIFVTSFMIIAGIRIIMVQEPDERMTYTVGIAFILGLSVDVLPGVYEGLPGMLKVFFNSSLVLSTTIAVVLNQILNLGSRLFKKKRIESD